MGRCFKAITLFRPRRNFCFISDPSLKQVWLGLFIKQKVAQLCCATDVIASAEKEGFEPPVQSPGQRFSRPPQSTTLPFLRRKDNKKMIFLVFIEKTI
jgi:hypothetical protein